MNVFNFLNSLNRKSYGTEKNFGVLQGIGDLKRQKAIDMALEKYPILEKNKVEILNNPQIENIGGGLLEFYPADEPRRPEGTEGRDAIAVFSPETTPYDMLLDYVSHGAIKTDPTVKQSYEQLIGSLTPGQLEAQRKRYRDYSRGYYVDGLGQKRYLANPTTNQPKETRSFEQWKNISDDAGIFRGALGQWDKRAFTQPQLERLEKLMKYLNLQNNI